MRAREATRTALIAGLLGVVGLTGCSDLTFRRTPPPPVADPPTRGDDGTGSPPDWTSCETAWLGQYFNLVGDEPGIEADPEDPPLGIEELPYWEPGGLTFQQRDTALDFGAAWWPVDTGVAGDPSYFAVRWTAWIRAFSDTSLEIALGAKDDAWVRIAGEEVASIVGAEQFSPELLSVPLDAGQYSIEVRYAHRIGDDDGMLFRIASGDVRLCEPEFD